MKIENLITKTFDEVFEELNMPKLYENQNFVQNKKFSNEFSQLFNSIDKLNRVKISFWIEKNNSVDFYIDRTNELPSFSQKWILNNREEFKNFVKDLFNTKLKIEYQGRKTIIYFIDDNLNEIRRLKYSEGIKINIFEKKEFKVYEKFFDC